MPQVKAAFFIPLRDNDGRDLATEITNLETAPYVTFVGRTMTGTVKGMYPMKDLRPAFDECNAYMVVMDSARVSELEVILKGFKQQTTQEAIYPAVQHDADVRFI